MKGYLTVQELAEQKSVSKTAIYKKIYSGELRAEKKGKQYLILEDDASKIEFRKKKRMKKEKLINQAVKRSVKEYREAFKMLGED